MTSHPPKWSFACRLFHAWILFVFLLNSIVPPSWAQTVLNLPSPGVRVSLSPEFVPSVLKGIKIDPKNPFQFDFIVDTGDESTVHRQQSTASMDSRPSTVDLNSDSTK